jgi:phosphoribosyl 1,2-cyclic phosphodiesterase
MKLHCLGSSSKGNSYVLEGNTSALVIEAGVPVAKVKQALKFNVLKIAGCIASHIHGDHFRYADKYLKSGINIYASKGTIDNSKLGNYGLFIISHNQQIRIGEFIVLAFDVQHDAPEPLGFLIYHPECGKILFITDSYYSKYTFHGLNHIILECNYISDILDSNVNSGKLHPSVRNRVVKSHFELQNVIDLLKANDLTNVRNIVLTHLSDGNSDEKRIEKEVKEATGKMVFIADKNLQIDFGL